MFLYVWLLFFIGCAGMITFTVAHPKKWLGLIMGLLACACWIAAFIIVVHIPQG